MRNPTDWNKYWDNPDAFILKYFFHRHQFKALADLLKNINFKDPIEILEFGSGSGAEAKWLCQRFKVKKITCIDSNDNMLNLSRKILANVQCEVDLLNLDFFNYESDKQYDIVYSGGVIEHFEPEKRYELLKKHCSATRPDGFCLLYFPTPTKSYWFFRKIYEILGIWIFTDEVPLEADVVIEEMKSLNFNAIKSNIFWKHFLTEAGIIFKRNPH